MTTSAQRHPKMRFGRRPCNRYAESVYMVNAIHGFVFVLDEELADGNLVAVIVTTPSGKTVQLWAEVELLGRTLILRQLAMYGLTATAGGLGAPALRNMAPAAMEDFDVDRIRIEDTRRASGAGASRAVRPIELRRQARQNDSDIAELGPPG